MNQKLGKSYKLCSKTVIQEIFDQKNSVKSFPLLLHYSLADLPTDKKFQITFSVPKRSFKKAVDRNQIKRLMKEVLRKNKYTIEELILQDDKKLALFLIYAGKEMPDYNFLESKIVVLLNRLQDKVRTSDT